jgi:hypothetical protein
MYVHLSLFDKWTGPPTAPASDWLKMDRLAVERLLESPNMFVIARPFEQQSKIAAAAHPKILHKYRRISDW